MPSPTGVKRFESRHIQKYIHPSIFFRLSGRGRVGINNIIQIKLSNRCDQIYFKIRFLKFRFRVLYILHADLATTKYSIRLSQTIVIFHSRNQEEVIVWPLQGLLKCVIKRRSPPTPALPQPYSLASCGISANLEQLICIMWMHNRSIAR